MIKPLRSIQVLVVATLLLTAGGFVGVSPVSVLAGVSAAAATSCPTIEASFYGDWNGDGIDTPAIRRGNTWLFTNSLSDSYADPTMTASFGAPSDTPLVGDWNGDGKDTLAVKRGNTYFITSSLGGPAVTSFSWGAASDVPIVGDWNGDGKDTIGLYRAPNTFILGTDINFASPGTAPAQFGAQFTYGPSGSTPVAGDWLNSGSDSVGVRYGNTWYFRNDATGANARASKSYGNACDLPLTGHFALNSASAIAVHQQSGWVHETAGSSSTFPIPEILTTQTQLATARQQVAAGAQPWTRAYNEMQNTMQESQTAATTYDDQVGQSPHIRSYCATPAPNLQYGTDPYQGTDYGCYAAYGMRQASVTRDWSILAAINDPALISVPTCTVAADGFNYVTDNEACHARALLLAWANDPNISTAIASSNGNTTSIQQINAALVLARVTSVFSDAYAMAWRYFAPTERATINAWLNKIYSQIQAGQNAWYASSANGGETYANHPMNYIAGELAIGLALDDVDKVNWVLTDPSNPDTMRTMINGALLPANATASDLFKCDPTALGSNTTALANCKVAMLSSTNKTYTTPYAATHLGEVYDRYRSYLNSPYLTKPYDPNNASNHGPSGMGYAVLNLREMTYMAVESANSGWDTTVLRAATSKGVKLSDAYQFYAPFFGGTTSGYYAYDTAPNVTASAAPIWEIANATFPGNAAISSLIGRMDAAATASTPTIPYDPEGLGYTPALLFRPTS